MDGNSVRFQTDISYLDYFIVLQTLGKGSTAKVKSVQDPNTKEIFAAKILRNVQDIDNKIYYTRIMENEIKCLSRVNHGNVAKIISANNDGIYAKKNNKGSYICNYIIMELYENGDLFDYLYCTGGFDERISRFYFIQLLDGLSACHNAGIAHRDLKSENILVDCKFNLKITDFGLSIPLIGRYGTNALYSKVCTLNYMAPEIHNGDPYKGENADLFALGIILFIMVSGGPPFQEAVLSNSCYRLLCRNNQGFWAMHSQSKPYGFYTPEFKSLVSQMLALDPSNRLSIENIKNHPWLNGPIATPEEVFEEMLIRTARRAIPVARIVTPRTTNNYQKNNIIVERKNDENPPIANINSNDSSLDSSPIKNATHNFSSIIHANNINVESIPIKNANQITGSYILTNLEPEEIINFFSNELSKLNANHKISLASHYIDTLLESNL